MSDELPSRFKYVTVWLLLGLVVFLGFQWVQHRSQQTRLLVDGNVVEIRRSADGHYHWPGRVNGRTVDFLIDTGATASAIPAAFARELGLESLGPVQSRTAGGNVTGQLVSVDIDLDGGVSARRVRVLALPALSGPPLLGMDILGKLRWQQRNGVLRIDLHAER
jgi:aspartyl protease family protein